ncbi:unnamed protein product [Aureobasidium pullulans]|nr:unnamed protein product [Aureobasidium pullulans]
MRRSAITFLPGALTIAPSSSGGNTTASNTQQQQPNTTGLFGQAPAASSQPQQSGGLFGASTATSQPQQSGGLFGNTSAAPAAKPTLSLFGNTQSSTSTSQPQQQQSGGLLEVQLPTTTTHQPPEVFSVVQRPTTPLQTLEVFWRCSRQQYLVKHRWHVWELNTKPGSASEQQCRFVRCAKACPQVSCTGSSTAQQSNNNFGSSLLNPLGGSTVRPLAGSLTMGQGNTPQSSTQPGVKIDLKQENYATQCEAMIVGHAANVESIKPDVDLIQNKIETVELALENDGAAIANAKELVQRDAGDLIRVARMAENLQLPQQYHYGRSSRPSTTDDEYDIDLVGYFGKQAEVMQRLSTRTPLTLPRLKLTSASSREAPYNKHINSPLKEQVVALETVQITSVNWQRHFAASRAASLVPQVWLVPAEKVSMS